MRGVGQSGCPPPPARLRAGVVTSRRLEVPVAEAREGAGAERVLYKRSPPSARSRSPRPLDPRQARPRPPARTCAPGGGWAARDRAPGGGREKGRAAGGRGA